MKEKVTKDDARSMLIKYLARTYPPKAKFTNILPPKIIKVLNKGDGFFVPIELDETNKSIKILHLNELKIAIRQAAKLLAETNQVKNNFISTAVLDDLSSSILEDTTKAFLAEKSVQFSEPIAPFAFKSDPTWTFHRINFDRYSELKPTPTWDRLLDNFYNKDAIALFIGSIFVPDSDRTQYLWLYGTGANGKSTIVKILSQKFPTLTRFDQPPQENDRFWTYGLMDKRLIVFDDCTKYSFVRNGVFKNLTGGTKVRVERKNMDSHDVDFFCKIIITSNEEPLLSSDPSDQRRVIFAKAIHGQFEHDPEFEPKLLEESEYFISNCVHKFKAMGPLKYIPCDNSAAQELGENFSEDIEAFIENHFDFEKTAQIAVAEFVNLLNLKGGKLNKRHIYRYLADQEVYRGCSSINGKITKVIKGIRLKNGGFYAV